MWTNRTIICDEICTLDWLSNALLLCSLFHPQLSEAMGTYLIILAGYR